MFDRNQLTHLGSAVDVTVPAPHDLTVGSPLFVGGSIPAVSANKVPAGGDAVMLTTGRHQWRKDTAETWNIGQPLYLNAMDPDPANWILSPIFPATPGRYPVFGVAWAEAMATATFGEFKLANELTFHEVT